MRVWMIALAILVPCATAHADFVLQPERLHDGYFAVDAGSTLQQGDTCTMPQGVANCTATAPAANQVQLTGAGCAAALHLDDPLDAARLGSATIALGCTSGGNPLAITVRWPTTLAQGAVPIRLEASGPRAAGAAIDPAATIVARGRANWEVMPAPATVADLTNFAGKLVFYRASALGNWTLATVSPAGNGGAATGGQAAASCAGDPASWCETHLAGIRQGACYVDTGRGDLQLIARKPDNHILRPNTSFVVVVRHRVNRSVEASLSGTIAITEPTIDRQNVSGQTTSETATECTASRASFGPRQAGQALQLEVELHQNRNVLDTERSELIVEQTYWGALRIGVGLPFGAVDRSYTAEQIGGSPQREIVAAGGDLDVELVASFAAFFEAFDGGRSYVRSDGPHLGLFAAAGLLASSQRGAQFLTSFYLGLEWEVMRSFSIGIAGVVRRVQRLIDGYAVGDAVNEGATLSAEQWVPGVALVVCVSPEFLQFAGAIAGGGGQ